MYKSYEMLGVFFIENALYTNAIMLQNYVYKHNTYWNVQVNDTPV